MKPIVVIILLASFLQSYAQSSHNINVRIDQEDACESLSIEANESNTFQIYPNPANTHLNIKFHEVIKEVIVYNLIGQEVVKHLVMSDTVTIDVSAIQSSIYTLQIKSDSKISNHKIIISHD